MKAAPKRSKASRAPKSLAEYIHAIGDEEFAKRYKVTLRATLSYRYGDRFPRPDLARRIVSDASSQMDWQAVYAQPARKFARRSAA